VKLCKTSTDISQGCPIRPSFEKLRKRYFNPVSGSGTVCTAEARSTLPSPPPPLSFEEVVAAAEAKTEQAEVSRDALLADNSDKKTKAKLLADAAIAGVKVTKVAMALTADTEVAACMQAFSKLKLDASLGACDVAIASSTLRQRLVAETTV
jgi:CHASE2 domain-containing sensor protein